MVRPSCSPSRLTDPSSSSRPTPPPTQVPTELRGYETLLTALGVPKEFSPGNYVEVLRNIGVQWGGRPLDADTLATAVGEYCSIFGARVNRATGPGFRAPRPVLVSVLCCCLVVSCAVWG